jgi:hypothetical protein
MSNTCRICLTAAIPAAGASIALKEVVDAAMAGTLSAEALNGTHIVTPCDGSVCIECGIERARSIAARKAAEAARPKKPARKSRRRAAPRGPWDGNSHPWAHDEE